MARRKVYKLVDRDGANGRPVHVLHWSNAWCEVIGVRLDDDIERRRVARKRVILARPADMLWWQLPPQLRAARIDEIIPDALEVF